MTVGFRIVFHYLLYRTTNGEVTMAYTSIQMFGA